MNREEVQRAWYRNYYGPANEDRNSLRRNRGVLFQMLAYEASIVRCAYELNHDPAGASVLDVGCGGGGDIYQLLRLGYRPLNITGIDIQQSRLDEAIKLYPGICFIHGDATAMDFEDESFDLVFESTMFATLPLEKERTLIAREMVRVCDKKGYILLVDWRMPKLGDPNYKALTRKELNKLFFVAKDTSLIGIYRGALVPPLGRFLSQYMSGLYFPMATLFPFLIGQVCYLLQKN